MNIKHNFQLRNYNSFRTEALAKLFCAPESVDEIIELLKLFPSEEKLILGAGCNLFFTKDFNGLVIKPNLKGVTILSENEDWVEIEAGAAEDWDDFVNHCVSNGWSGIENLSLIPGSVGAAPIQNIGAYGTEVKDVITAVKVIEIATGDQMIFENENCIFEYRNSIFKQTRKYIITSVVFKLNKSFTYHEKYVDLNNELKSIRHPSLSQVRDAIIKIRTRKLPDHMELPNAGSFFKNPILTSKQKENLQNLISDIPIYNIGENRFKTSAAFLIEKAGYKGKRTGDVGTYEKHALIIVNYGTPDGKQISRFMQEIQQVIRNDYGIDLEPEVWVF